MALCSMAICNMQYATSNMQHACLSFMLYGHVHSACACATEEEEGSVLWRGRVKSHGNVNVPVQFAVGMWLLLQLLLPMPMPMNRPVGESDFEFESERTWMSMIIRTVGLFPACRFEFELATRFACAACLPASFTVCVCILLQLQ